MGTLIAQAFLALMNALYKLGEYLAKSLFDAAMWVIEHVFYWLLKVVFDIVEKLTGGLDWLPQIVWGDDLKLALEYANNFLPVNEAALIVPAVLAFEGMLLIFKLSRWLIWI